MINPSILRGILGHGSMPVTPQMRAAPMTPTMGSQIRGGGFGAAIPGIRGLVGGQQGPTIGGALSNAVRGAMGAPPTRAVRAPSSFGGVIPGIRRVGGF